MSEKKTPAPAPKPAPAPAPNHFGFIAFGEGNRKQPTEVIRASEAPPAPPTPPRPEKK